MAKNYNNYGGYNHNEQRKQQQRKQYNNAQKVQRVLEKHQVYAENECIRTVVEEGEKEKPLVLTYRDADYVVCDGWNSTYDILKIHKWLNDKSIPKSFFDMMEKVNEIFVLAFGEDGYKKFKNNNPNISFKEMTNVSEAITTLIFFKGVAKEQDNFRDTKA